MTLKEMRNVFDLLDNEWDLGKTISKSRGKICAWVYLFEILEESEIVIMEKENNKVIGICGYAKWNSKKGLIKKRFYTLLKKLLIHSPFINNKKALIKYNEDYDYTPKELKNYFDGEISILIVDERFRGKGVGKKLLLKILKIAKNDNMKNLQILTDQSCNFKFYEKLNCTKIYEKIIPEGEPDKLGNVKSDIGYIYEKKLNDIEYENK